MTITKTTPKDGECAKCGCWTGKQCGNEVVEGRGRCRHDEKPVGLGEGFVSPFEYEENEERGKYW